MSDQRREHPSTYFVQDRSNLDEMTRLHIQDQIVTESMGGVLPEQSNPASFQRVLDVRCGTGDWLIGVARLYPTIKLLVGVDISATMIDFARRQAVEAGVSDRVQFCVMDALRRLEFRNGYFSLVNHRFGVSWLRTWDWPKLLDEYQRVCEVGGIIRLTEGDAIIVSKSPALTRLCQLTLDAFSRAGHYFLPESNGITGQLAHLLTQQEVQHIQTRSYQVEYRASTLEGQQFSEDLKIAFRLVIPFLRKWTRVPDDYEATYQQALEDMQQADFLASIHLLTVWGSNQSQDTSKDFSSVS